MEKAIPSHPYYFKKSFWNPRKYPNAVSFGKQTLSLPISPVIDDKS